MSTLIFVNADQKIFLYVCRSSTACKVRDLVGRRLFDLFYFQLLRMHAFHADPHWGNYLFRADGTIGLVDFGCVKYLPATFVEGYRKTFLYNGRYDTDDFRRLLEEHYTLSGHS